MDPTAKLRSRMGNELAMFEIEKFKLEIDCKIEKD